MNEQITEQTNNSEGVQGTGTENGVDTSTAVASSVATENPDANKTTEGGNGAIDTEPKEGEGNAQKEGAGEKAPKQDKAKNAEMARQRREREHQEEIKRARIEGIKSVISTNPYTSKPIEDDSDVEEYLLMKQIEKDGKDPITDYPEYVKKQARERVAQAQAKTANVTKELEEFSTVYPNVKINDVLQDAEFAAFADGKLGKMSLALVYSQYLLDKSNKAAMADAKREADKAAHAQAVGAAAVGSLTNANEPPDKDFFTKEQVLKMSRKEISDNYEKIRKSQEKW